MLVMLVGSSHLPSPIRPVQRPEVSNSIPVEALERSGLLPFLQWIAVAHHCVILAHEQDVHHCLVL